MAVPDVGEQSWQPVSAAARVLRLCVDAHQEQPGRAGVPGLLGLLIFLLQLLLPFLLFILLAHSAHAAQPDAVAWHYPTGATRGHEAAPIVADGMMYIVTPYPNTVHALDLAKPGGPAKWTFEPNPHPSSQGVACCDVVNRGAAFAAGRLFSNTLDNQTIALDAANGKELWRTRLGDIDLGETMTMAPLVVGNLVLVGNSGGEMGVRGWLTALHAKDGSIAWRAWSTGPDSDVLIGPGFKPFYASDRGKDLGVASWPAEA